MLTTDFVLILLGLAALLVGAEMLVRGSVRLAERFGVPSIIIGLTVVAFGTSAPELGVSLQAAFAGSSGLALGNVVGSNLFNVLFILGDSALITPLAIAPRLLRIDMPLLLGASLLVPLFAFNGRISAFEGALFLALGAVHLYFLARAGKRETPAPGEGEGEGEGEVGTQQGAGESTGGASLGTAVLLTAAGLGALVLGSNWLVDGSTALALRLGVEETVIGVTLVAAGTSLPEVATSVLAAIRSQRDLAVGNVVGSNLFNIFWVLGAAAVAAPAGLGVSASAFALDIPVMVVSAFLCFPLLRSGRTLVRWEGAVLFGGWLAYTTYRVAQAVG